MENLRAKKREIASLQAQMDALHSQRQAAQSQAKQAGASVDKLNQNVTVLAKEVAEQDDKRDKVRALGVQPGQGGVGGGEAGCAPGRLSPAVGAVFPVAIGKVQQVRVQHLGG